MVNRYNPDIHHRRSIRLKTYDYSRAGKYFLTICAHNRECLFGSIENGVMVLNRAGKIVADAWAKTAEIRNEIELDQWVVMPNHFHGILVIIEGRGTAPGRDTARRIEGRGTARRAPTAERFGHPVAGSIPTIIRSFKSAVTKHINELRKTPGHPVWQRNYYEHIIRDEADYDRIAEYIADNPRRWADDSLNPDNMAVRAPGVAGGAVYGG